MKTKQLFTIVFVVISLIEIAADLSGKIILVYVFKPAIVLSLLGLTIRTWKGSPNPIRYKFILALIFAVAGDIFLMIRGADLFIPGLASFLIMQILYIATFRSDIPVTILKANTLLSILPFSLIAMGLYTVLFPGLPDPIMRVAVAIYAFSIATMAWMAWMRKAFVSPDSFQYVFLGAILFMISDSLIAISRFLSPIPWNTLWVMGTYAAAQYFIVIGILKKQAHH